MSSRTRCSTLAVGALILSISVTGPKAHAAPVTQISGTFVATSVLPPPRPLPPQLVGGVDVLDFYLVNGTVESPPLPFVLAGQAVSNVKVTLLDLLDPDLPVALSDPSSQFPGNSSAPNVLTIGMFEFDVDTGFRVTPLAAFNIFQGTTKVVEDQRV